MPPTHTTNTPNQHDHPSTPSHSRPSKRRRSNMPSERASSSSDVSSQSGMADNETEPDPEPSPAPPKKKRTRTLTTPHQSAVLHALLAKSRFPTTAMREEVGRQIGLSARKVQIWFQNQRQKARRPQSESGPLTRPPQFGPFPIMTPTGPLPAGGHADSPSLSGPGIPGWSHQRGHSEEWDPPRRAPISPDAPLPLAPRDTSPRDSRYPEASPHFSRILPPIHLGALEPRSSADSPRSSQPSFINTVLRPDPGVRSAPASVVDPGSPVRMGIPPPFALQPQPQWDPHTFSPFTRPEFASWSHASGSTLSLASARSSFSAVGWPPSGQERRGLDPPFIPSSQQRHSDAGTSFRGSTSGRGHARSDDEDGDP